MENNDRLIRLRYALDIKDTDIVEIFKLGGIKLTKEEVQKMLTKSKDDTHSTADKESGIEGSEESIRCNNSMLDSFLNGFIIFKRGKQDSDVEKPANPQVLSLKESVNVSNVLLKKLKIALALSSEDMIDIFEEAGVTLSKGELSAILRKEGHRNYRECGDSYARNFLKGLAIKHRK
jgi:uncharacterized protein YehS (DUF1456 family)